MYFPYLYGRRSELLALRAMLADHRSLDSLLPVIEPVVSKPGDLVKCIEAFGKQDERLAVLLNPDKHELAGGGTHVWRKAVVASIKAADSVLPALRCSPGTTKAQVDAFIAEFPDHEVVLAYSSPGLNDAEIAALAGRADVKYHLVLNGKLSAHKQGLLPIGKRVLVEDRFNKLARNADYGAAELFTDRHSTYIKDKWAGFGDYTCLGAEFIPGGGAPAAVAVHACYKHNATEVWAAHYVSDDTDKDVGTTASKFVQAAKKLVKAVNARPNQFGTNFALDEFEQHVKANHFPGLGKSKELQISHHLCVTLDVVDGVI
ncbi:sce7725 family protein [Hydrogenophaga laconesensis]|uniref:Sce7725 family protein n=1 Tax=Hydrogenophaga laconesensis TaxID=1805971 RepID=A0ABU1V907_9BURK|nr:sce7725 family protein [Hydrogenophaga laconesensis]MDR7093939.1 hypothetical protein [Hydrogenophaga laconesensis]NIQ81852.1 sce7725 family protein [Anaerolineae bacterium]